MNRRLSRRGLFGAAGGAAVIAGMPRHIHAQQQSRFLLTNPTSDAVTFLEDDSFDLLPVAPSPWGLAVDGRSRAFIAAAQGMSIVDLTSRTVTSTVAYQTPIDSIGYGEYRSGGMGIAVTPDGGTVAVGIHLNGSNGLIELYDVEAGMFVATVPAGIRPFDVVASLDSKDVYSIDHDSFTVTAVELSTLTPSTIDAAPLGHGEFDKPHYAAMGSNGSLLLPYVGQLLWELNPSSGAISALTMTANTHQHGITLSDDESTAYIVGTGPAGPAPGPPGLTILNLATGLEHFIELALPHEQVALTDNDSTAILTGGYTFANGGWDGITRIDLATGEISTLEIPGRPLAIRRI